MTNKNKLENLEKYKYAGVAALALQNQDKVGAAKSLEYLLKDWGVEEKLDRQTLLTSILKSDTIPLYANRYAETLKKISVSELFDHYSNYIKNIIGDCKDKLISDFGGETYGNIEDKIRAAKEIKESETTNFSEEQKNEAEETLKKYSVIYNPIMRIQERALTELYNPIQDESIRDYIKEYYKEE